MNGLEIATWGNFIVEMAILFVLVEEYYFDRRIYEQKRRRVKRTKNQVKIEVDTNGNAQITEKPENVEVIVSHKEG